MENDLVHPLECHVVTHLPGIAGAHSVDYTILRLLVRYLVTKSYLKRSDVHPGGRIPSFEAFECVKDMVGHLSSAKESWIHAIEKAGMFNAI
jgi:hypothetical protein